MTVYTWAINTLERHTADGIVYSVHYTVDANDGTYSAGAYGSVGLEPPDMQTMIPYANLTKATVIGWVQDKLGGEEKVAEIEASLQTQLDEQHQPSRASGLPWSN